MDAIGTLATKLGNFYVNETIRKILNTQKYQEDIPDMIKSRLNDSGTYSTGEQIATYASLSPDVYSRVTIGLKKMKGQTTKHVTLKDTGAFHNTFALHPKAYEFTIDYNEDKPDGKISETVELDNVFNLSEKELIELRTMILPDFIEEFRNAIL
ncbi:MAG: hypothetical protein DRJ15_13625 [Bacteroidetes bacterium]|nr:MAG: hypothetical protein DRJ15_13625 [Bacteroidota bacterium]